MYFNVFQVVWLTPLLLLWVLMYSALKLPVVSSFRYNQEANYLVNLTCYSSNTEMQCWSCAAPSCWWRRSSSARCAACVSVQTWEAEGFCPLLATRSHFHLFQRPPLPPLCIFFTQLLHKMSQKNHLPHYRRDTVSIDADDRKHTFLFLCSCVYWNWYWLLQP